MMYLIKKLKLLQTVLVALSFLVAVSLTSCGGSNSYSDEEESDATESVEESADSSEEHPEGEEQAEGDEHPSDSTAKEGDHPESEDSEEEDN